MNSPGFGATALGGSDLDIQAAAPPPIVRGAGGAVLGAGALALLVGLQTLSGFVVRSTLHQVWLGLFVLLGAAGAVSGLRLMRARDGAATVAVAASAALVFAASVWLLLSLAGGLLSLFALAAPPVSVMALIGAILSITPCRRVAAARARLREAGLDIGV